MARVLIVDDEEPIRRMVRQVVERLGHRVEEATDGMEALASFQFSPHDLVITDILMPRMGGLRLVSELRALDPAQKIVAMSGQGQEGSLNFLGAVKSFEGVHTLQKPFRPQELMDLIAELLPGEGAEPVRSDRA